MKNYYDKYGERIFPGSKIHCTLDDSVEEVVACGNDDLGIVVGKDGSVCEGECYPLSAFDMDQDWEIVHD